MRISLLLVWLCFAPLLSAQQAETETAVAPSDEPEETVESQSSEKQGDRSASPAAFKPSEKVLADTVLTLPSDI